MTRHARCDEPGSWHHIINRGIARRSLFETRADIRYFLARLATAVRRGQLEVHAYCILTTHFHLLARSPLAQLSAAMRQVQLDYVRRFNRGRRRDGPLVRGRFLSKRVRSLLYRETLVRYIDSNATRAGLVSDAREYPFGSAYHYARSDGPAWLERRWVESTVCDRTRIVRFDPAVYSQVFGASASEAEQRLVERRIEAPDAEDRLDDLVAAAPAQVLDWLRWKARLADRTEPGLPVADSETIDAAIRARREGRAPGAMHSASAATDPLMLAHAGLLREMSASTLSEIASRTGRSPTNVWNLCRRHAQRLSSDVEYAREIGILAREVLDACHRGRLARARAATGLVFGSTASEGLGELGDPLGSAGSG